MKRLFIVTLSAILLLVSLPFFIMNAEAGEEKEVRIAVLPWEVRAAAESEYIKDALFDMVSSRVSVEKHLVVVGKSATEEVFLKYKGKGLPDDLIRKMGKELKVDYVLIGSLTFIGENLSIDAKALKVKAEDAPIYAVSQSRGIDSLIPMLGRLIMNLNRNILEKEGLPVTKASSISTPGYTGSFDTSTPPPVKEPVEKNGDFIIDSQKEGSGKAFWKSQAFITELKGIGAGDTDGDNRNEVVLIDRHNLWIYRKTGDTLELVKEFKGRIFEENLTVDVADLNGNGVAEVYVTRLNNDRLDSYVLEYTDGDYIKVSSSLRWFLKTVSLPKGGQILLGQKRGINQVFWGNVKKLYWDENNLTEGEDVDLPPGFNIYGFVQLDINDGEREKRMLGFDSGDHLRLYSKAENEGWREVWKSVDFFGGTLNAIRKGSKRGGAHVDIKGRIIQKDLDEDGKREIVINRNIASGLGRYVKGRKSYEKGEILNMSWTGDGLEENWKTRMIEGYIADFQIMDIDNDGVKDLIATVVADFKSFRKKPQSYIISHRLDAR